MTIEDFTKQVLPHKNKLFRFSLGIVGDIAEAEDVVQEVFIKLWNKRHQWVEYQNMEAWCMRLTRNASIDKLRSKHRRVEPVDKLYDTSHSAADPYQVTEMRDTCEQVRQMMMQLPEKQRMVMQLRDVEGMSYQEISEILEISLSQVKINLFRARQRIRRELTNTQSYGL